MNPRKWWIPITIILVISITGVSIIGYETYYKAPPIPDVVTENGDPVFKEDDIHAGKAAFQKYALMEYGIMFLMAVNFWNFFGTGVLGFIINLPLTNYYEHGTYLTVNHGHASLMGVYGNLSIATILFCCQLVTKNEYWKGLALRISFWSINIGLLLWFSTIHH